MTENRIRYLKIAKHALEHVLGDHILDILVLAGIVAITAHDGMGVFSTIALMCLLAYVVKCIIDGTIIAAEEENKKDKKNKKET